MIDADELRVYSATSFVGHGVDQASLDAALGHGIDAIVAQGTTTDAGAYYLGEGVPVMAEEALYRDLVAIITAARKAGVPFIVSAGGCGSDATTRIVLDLVGRVCEESCLDLRVGVVWSQIDPAWLAARVKAGVIARRIVPSPRLEAELTVKTVERCCAIVAQAGPEVIMTLLKNNPGLDGIICGRSLDIGLYAAIPLMRGFDRGLAMHFGKIMEDGALAATPGSGNDGLLGIIRGDHFDVFPVNPNRRCTPVSVVAHAFYERSNPMREINPGGALDISEAAYTQIDDRTVRVAGSKWIHDLEYRVKVEGAEPIGYRSICIAGARDPSFLGRLDLVLAECSQIVDNHFAYLPRGSWMVDYKVYGRDAVLGPSEPTPHVEGHEVCILMNVVAETQKLADGVCSFASSTISHHGFPGRTSTAGNLAMPFSPGRAISVGRAYQFSIWHAMPLTAPGEPFRTEVRVYDKDGRQAAEGRNRA